MTSLETWPAVPIREVSRRVTVGFVGSQAPHFVECGVPLLRGQNVKPMRLDFTSLKHISPQTHDKWSKSALTGGEVVIVRVGYPGVAAVVPPDLGPVNAASLVIVRPDPEALDAHFLAYLLNSPWGRAAVAARFVGAAQQVLNTNAVADLEIRLPPLNVQQRVVEPLRALDDLIENNQQRVEVLEGMARAIYREWFVRFRYPGHEDVPLVDSPLGPIPDGWTLSTCGDELTALGGATPAKKEGAFWEGGTIPWFTPSDLTKSKQRYAGEPELSITSEGLARSSARLFPKGSVLMTSRATLGVLAIATLDATTNQGFIVIPPDDRWSPSFIYEWLDFHADALAAVATGATFKEITKGAFKRVPFLVPHQDVLDAHRESVEPIESEIRVLEEQTLALGHLRDLLLPKLVTGQIDVSHLDLDALTGAATA